MQAAEVAVHQVARRQAGVVGRFQALEAGLSADQIHRRLRSGEWERVHPQVYLLPAAADEWRQRLWAAHLWGGPASTVSHRSAAALWELEGFPPGPVELTVPSGAHHRAARGVRTHQSRLPPGDRRALDGLPVTSPERTLTNLAARHRESTVDDAMESAFRLGLTTAERLLAALDGRPGTARVRALLADRGTGRPRGSALEGAFLRLVRTAGLPRPARQVKVVVAGRTFYLDFAYPDRRVAIELDGLAKRTRAEAVAGEHRRQNLLVLAGWTVLRFTRAQLRAEPEAVVATIRAALAAPLAG